MKNWIVRKLRFSQLNRIRWGIKVWQNHKLVIKLSESSQFIFLKPIAPTGLGGHIEHYYHFIFDLLLPISFLIRKTSSKTIFVLDDFGILTPLLLGLFGDRVKIQNTYCRNLEEKTISLIGMNPKIIPIQYFQFKTLKTRICAKLNIHPSKKPTKILLIERLAPDSYYFTKAQNKGSGSSRRSIKNHETLKAFIASKVKSNYEFHNLQLERMSLKDQISYFDSACIVIAQHGAGLSNILWMHEQSIVIELGFKSRIYFKRLSKIMKHNYILFDYDEQHIKVDGSELHKNLLENKITRSYFRK